MNTIKIPAKHLTSYLGACMSAYAWANFVGGIARFSKKHPDENLVSIFERIAVGDTADIEPVPLMLRPRNILKMI